MNRTLMWPLAALLFLGCANSGTSVKSGAPTAAATLTGEERERLGQDLEATRRAFLSSVQGLSEAQLRFRAAPDRWTIAEVAEHIALSEQRIFEGMILDKVMRSPAPPELSARGPRDDEGLRRMVLDRSTKRQAPEMLKPTGSFPSTAAAVEAFGKSRDRTVEFVRSTQEDLRGHGAPHPLLKMLDGYQWVILLSSHSARHTAQIEEVKADPGFPRS